MTDEFDHKGRKILGRNKLGKPIIGYNKAGKSIISTEAPRFKARLFDRLNGRENIGDSKPEGEALTRRQKWFLSNGFDKDGKRAIKEGYQVLKSLRDILD